LNLAEGLVLTTRLAAVQQVYRTRAFCCNRNRLVSYRPPWG
jgi:hypothetical protein